MLSLPWGGDNTIKKAALAYHVTVTQNTHICTAHDRCDWDPRARERLQISRSAERSTGGLFELGVASLIRFFSIGNGRLTFSLTHILLSGTGPLN